MLQGLLVVFLAVQGLLARFSVAVACGIFTWRCLLGVGRVESGLLSLVSRSMFD